MELESSCRQIERIEKLQKDFITFHQEPCFIAMEDSKYKEMQEYKREIVKQMAAAMGIHPVMLDPFGKCKQS